MVAAGSPVCRWRLIFSKSLTRPGRSGTDVGETLTAVCTPNSCEGPMFSSKASELNFSIENHSRLASILKKRKRPDWAAPPRGEPLPRDGIKICPALTGAISPSAVLPHIDRHSGLCLLSQYSRQLGPFGREDLPT